MWLICGKITLELWLWPCSSCHFFIFIWSFWTSMLSSHGVPRALCLSDSSKHCSPVWTNRQSVCLHRCVFKWGWRVFFSSHLFSHSSSKQSAVKQNKGLTCLYLCKEPFLEGMTFIVWAQCSSPRQELIICEDVLCNLCCMPMSSKTWALMMAMPFSHLSLELLVTW